MEKAAAVYIHGKGGIADEAARFFPLFTDRDLIGFDYKSQTPWEAKAEFPPFFESLRKRYGAVTLIANSIGAYFAMHALNARHIERAFFISPIVDMEALILKMMTGANVTENELRDKGEIPTAFGETLSWEYLRYARADPISWSVPTEVLYGEKDAMTPYASISAFAKRIGAGLTIMKNGEHWFHTEEQMSFLYSWIKQRLL